MGFQRWSDDMQRNHDLHTHDAMASVSGSRWPASRTTTCHGGGELFDRQHIVAAIDIALGSEPCNIYIYMYVVVVVVVEDTPMVTRVVREDIEVTT